MRVVSMNIGPCKCEGSLFPFQDLPAAVMQWIMTEEDVTDMAEYVSAKPAPAPAEFVDLAHKIMEEEQWYVQTDADSQLDLYHKLVDAVEAL